MLRSNCVNSINTKRCGKQFRSRVAHKLCRACYYLVNKTGRPIASRNKKERVVKVKHTPAPVTKGKRK
jgi:hypothetical protein